MARPDTRRLISFNGALVISLAATCSSLMDCYDAQHAYNRIFVQNVLAVRPSSPPPTAPGRPACSLGAGSRERATRELGARHRYPDAVFVLAVRESASVFRRAYTARAVCCAGIAVSAITTTSLWIGLGWVTLVFGVGGLVLAWMNHRGHKKGTYGSDTPKHPPLPE